MATSTVIPSVFTLVLTLEEAQTLRDVCACISGLMSTRRKHMAAINDALEETGLGWFDPSDLEGELEFSEGDI